MSNVTDKLAELRATAAERVHYSTITRDEQLQLIAAVEALRAYAIKMHKCPFCDNGYSEAHAERCCDELITDAAPMLGGERC